MLRQGEVSLVLSEKIELSNCWSPERFPRIFDFQQQGTRFAKEVKVKYYTFEPVGDAEGFLRVVKIQKLAWKWDDIDVAPTHILALAEDTGGGVFGAYNDQGTMVAFAAGFGGGKDTQTGEPTIISSMLAVAGDELRSGGVGRELKIIQAFYGFQKGYTANMRKLGAQAEEFWINKYGQMRSELYGPVPTDRFRAVWRFTNNTTIGRLLGYCPPPRLEDINDIPIATSDSLPNSPRVLVAISPNIDDEPDTAKIQRRFRLRNVMTHYFHKRSYIASEFVSGTSPDGKRASYYLLESSSSPLDNIRVPLS